MSVTSETPNDAPTQIPDSPEREVMIAAGAHAQDVDVNAMLATIKAMQERLQALEAERGVPSDPIKGAISNLVAHVEARAAQYPYIDFTEILNAVKELPETVTRDHTELVHSLVTDFTNTLKGLEVHYLPELSGVLHRAVLKKAVAA
jgi:hypothetical protein